MLWLPETQWRQDVINIVAGGDALFMVIGLALGVSLPRQLNKFRLIMNYIDLFIKGKFVKKITSQ